MSRQPKRGDVWKIDLELEVEEGTRGHEQGDQRPALIVSTDTFNSGPSGLVIVVPITSTQRNWKNHVQINPPEGGLTNVSALLCEQVRCISTLRLVSYYGHVSSATMNEVGDRLADLLELWSDQ